MALNRNTDGTFAGKDARIKTIFDEIEKLLNDPATKRGGKAFKIRNEISVYAYEWYLSNVKKLSRFTTKNALMGTAKSAPNFQIGKLYQYGYLPFEESRNEMKAYDIFPLMIPIGYGRTKDGDREGKPFIRGLNLHYIGPRDRFFLFADLLRISSISGTNENKRMQLSYELLQGLVTKNPNYIPCIHNYVMENVKTNIIQIPIDEWKIAVVMPNADFKKMGEQSVWMESRRKALVYKGRVR